MGWIYDLVKDLPSAPALKEQIALAEDKYAQAVEEKDRANKENEAFRQRIVELEKEVAELRARVPAAPEGDLGEDTQKVLIYLFRSEGDERAVGNMAQRLQMERSVAQYHLDDLVSRGLAKASGGNYLTGQVYWTLTQDGRRYVVENGLHTG